MNVQPFLGRGAPYRTRIDTFVMRVRQSFDFLSAGEDSPGCLDWYLVIPFGIHSSSFMVFLAACPFALSRPVLQKHPQTPHFPPRSSFLKNF